MRSVDDCGIWMRACLSREAGSVDRYLNFHIVDGQMVYDIFFSPLSFPATGFRNAFFDRQASLSLHKREKFSIINGANVLFSFNDGKC